MHQVFKGWLYGLVALIFVSFHHFQRLMIGAYFSYLSQAFANELHTLGRTDNEVFYNQRLQLDYN